MIYSNHKGFSNTEIVCCITANLVSFPFIYGQNNQRKSLKWKNVFIEMLNLFTKSIVMLTVQLF